jgi:DNA-directed RNA polymerase specialized sigma24 family protein
MPGMEYQAPDFTKPLTDLPNLVEERLLLRARLPALDKEIRQAVRKEYELGMPTSAIAEIVGVSQARIREILSWS